MVGVLEAEDSFTDSTDGLSMMEESWFLPSLDIEGIAAVQDGTNTRTTHQTTWLPIAVSAAAASLDASAV
jgi:hypothetical protein